MSNLWIQSEEGTELQKKPNKKMSRKKNNEEKVGVAVAATAAATCCLQLEMQLGIDGGLSHTPLEPLPLGG